MKLVLLFHNPAQVSYNQVKSWLIVSSEVKSKKFEVGQKLNIKKLEKKTYIYTPSYDFFNLMVKGHHTYWNE